MKTENRSAPLTPPDREIQFRQCVVTLWYAEGWLDTTFWDGLKCPADLTIATDDTLRTAVDTGYGDDLRRMHTEHEIAHTFLAEARGWDYSPVLRRVATNESPFDWSGKDEERTVLDFQRYVNGGEPSEGLISTFGPALSMWRDTFKSLMSTVTQ